MQIQINTDKNVDGHEQFAAQARSVVEGAIDRFRDRITRVEVHISDQNGKKSGQNDKRCVMEARMEGRTPAAVTHDAATVEDAVDGAAEKLARAIEHTIDRLATEADHRTDPPLPEPKEIEPAR
ncbi:MAG: HPF/RaiA family ribosome-associated protein [Vicinamibacteria bacterium]|nr:HPF/RaiA family ribosome-associated protein [Vicinamibacteria bacterium]